MKRKKYSLKEARAYWIGVGYRSAKTSAEVCYGIYDSCQVYDSFLNGQEHADKTRDRYLAKRSKKKKK